jgi:ankyrin repeat protein
MSTITQGRLDNTTNLDALQGPMISFIRQHIVDPELRTNIEPLKAIEVIEACSALARDRKTATHLDIELMIKRIRGVYENLVESSSLDDSLKGSLAALYGSDWFKCPKTWCDSFHEGFEERSLRESHVSQHERPFRCNVTGCPAADLGYDTGTKLKKHHSQNHQEVNNEGWKFPSPRAKVKTGIFRAAANGDLESVENFVREGVDMNRPSRRDGTRTPIYLALQNGRYEVAKFLIEQGVDTNFRWARGVGPLSLASKASLNPERLLNLLFDKLPDIETHIAYEGKLLMRWAAMLGKEMIIARLLQNGLNMGASPIGEDKLPLAWAAGNGHVAAAELLLANGAKADAMSLSLAIKSDNAVIVELLLKDIDKDLINSQHMIWAVQSGHEAIVKMLLKKGADVNFRDSQGQTLLSWAAEAGYEAIVRLLLEHGADVNFKNLWGQTPLSRAARISNEAIVNMLVERRSEVNS